MARRRRVASKTVVRLPHTSSLFARRALRRVALHALLILPLLASAAPISPGTFDLSAWRGKIVVVDFWASWCKPCRESMPWLNELRQRYGSQGLTIIGINVDADRRDAERFLKDTPVDFDLVFDPDGALASRFKVPGMPATYVFDRQGSLAERHLGFRQADRARFETQLQSLLGAPHASS